MNTSTAEVRDDLRRVVRAVLGDALPGVPLDWSVAARPGWLGLELSEGTGGAGAGFGEVAVVGRELGRAAAAAPFLGAVIGAGGAYGLVEPSEVVAQGGRSLADGSATPVLVLPGDVVPGEPEWWVQATPSPSGHRVSGLVDFVADAPVADSFVVPVLDEQNEGCLVAVDVGTTGVTVEARSVVDATRHLGRVRLVDVEVDPDHRWAFTDHPERCLVRLADRAALAIAIDSLGIAEAMLEVTVGYVGQREQFGRPVGSFQAVKHACADLAVAIEMVGGLCDAATETLDALPVGLDDRAVHTAVDRAAAAAKQCAVDAAGTAMQLHGGIGYTWDSGIHVYLKRAGLNRSLYGSPMEHRRRVAARWL